MTEHVSIKAAFKLNSLNNIFASADESSADQGPPASDADVQPEGGGTFLIVLSVHLISVFVYTLNLKHVFHLDRRGSGAGSGKQPEGK